jgi:multidrug resistance efflux pump
MNDEEKKGTLFSKPWVQSSMGMVVVLAALAGFLYWQSKAGTVSIEDSTLSAPIITLSPVTPGTLNALYVHEGDRIAPNTPVALVGTNTITSKSGGIVIDAQEKIGATIMSGQEVVSLIRPEDMYVIGSVEETKGLKDITPGQKVVFTVDAYGSKKYNGIVDTVSPSSEDTSIAFSISDKRPTRRFDVKVRFDTAQYPELKNGMSAKMTVYTR